MLLSCGDALIDFMPGKTGDGGDAYIPVVGGSCLNVAVTMSRLGASAGLVGGISTDMFGEMIATYARDAGVNIDHVKRSDAETTLAFVRFIQGEPHYAFYDETTATRLWTYAAGEILFDKVDALHVGSTSLIHDPASSHTRALVDEARQHTTISFDPNCRPNLVKDKSDYIRRMDVFFDRADIVRMSDVDFAFLFETDDYDAFAQRALKQGAQIVVITQGAKGACAWSRQAKVEVASPPVSVVDTIGAGDTFQGAFLTGLLEAGRLKRSALRDITTDRLKGILEFGVNCAAITCSRAGANPPYRTEIAADLARLTASGASGAAS